MAVMKGHDAITKNRKKKKKSVQRYKFYTYVELHFSLICPVGNLDQVALITNLYHKPQKIEELLLS